MRAYDRNERRRIRYGQAVLLGCKIISEENSPYRTRKWYARLPIKIGGMDAVTGPWKYRHEAVEAALAKMGVS